MRVQSLKRKAALASAIVIALCGAAGAVLWAGQPSDRPTIDASMSALVAEIRELRGAVERSGLMATQSQLLLGRLQLQENRLAMLGRQAQESRDLLNEAERAVIELETRVRRTTSAISSAQTAEMRQAIADQAEALKSELRQMQVKAQQLRARDSAASAALADEQGRWVDFNNRLETLERTIAAAAAGRTR